MEYAERKRTLRVSLVTETYLPEINGVAMTLGELVQVYETATRQIKA